MADVEKIRDSDFRIPLPIRVGLVGKLFDRSFRLENAYYLGLLMSLVLAAQKM